MEDPELNLVLLLVVGLSFIKEADCGQLSQEISSSSEIKEDSRKCVSNG